MANENALLVSLIDKIKKDALVLPTLPEVALRIRSATDKDDVSMTELADIIRQDPALAARIIKVANSVLYRRAVAVDSIQGALARIGMQQIRSLVTAAAMQQLFICNHPIIEDVMVSVWEQSVEVSSATCLLLQNYLARGGANPAELTVDGAQLAGLVHNIGTLPILAEAEQMPDAVSSPYLLKKVLERLQQPLGLNIIKNWRFGEEFQEVIKHWADPDYDPSQPNYADFVRLGALASGHLISRGVDTDALAENYVARGILPSADYFEQDEFAQAYQDLKDSFDL
ncbi:HDOD domain-containing protein [Gallaecimonas sp. GXIMD4217]|uniref:HDOD domain-containing protein n=1 Tax=Gallaecimonas sp. GXIMD4217 TaxID=3131927 RepID=UPI00311B3708